MTPRATAAAAHRCDGRMIPPCDTTRPSGCRFGRTVTCWLCWFAVCHAPKSTQRGVASTYVFFDTPTICPDAYHHLSVRVLIVEDEPYMAEAIRDGLRLEAIAADIAGDGDTALAAGRRRLPHHHTPRHRP